MRLPYVLCLALLVGVTAAQAQQPMPADRAAFANAVYSQIIPLNESVDRHLPHEFWFIQLDALNPVADDQPCFVRPDPRQQKDTPVYGLNPHTAVQIPADHKQEFAEILADWDQNCHQHWQLTPVGWHTLNPVLLLNASEQASFHAMHGDLQPGARANLTYKKNWTLIAFSPAYFNHDHSAALIYTTQWCGELCGSGRWVAYTREGHDWIPLPINAVAWQD